MRFVKLISKANLSESGRARGQIKLRRQKAISRKKTKDTTEAQKPEAEMLRLNESGLSSDHYTQRIIRVALF